MESRSKSHLPLHVPRGPRSALSYRQTPCGSEGSQQAVRQAALAAGSTHVVPHMSQCHQGYGDSWFHPEALQPVLRWAADPAVPCEGSQRLLG